MSSADLERAALRLRLAGAALATTLILLGGDAPSLLPIGLLGYVLLSAAARYATPRLPPAAARVAVVGAIGIDLAATSALMFALPLDRPAWMLFLFPIGNAALRSAALGAAAAAAIAIVLVDLVIALRLPEAEAIQLWPLQFLVAAALVAAELARLRERDEHEHDVLRRRAAAREDLSAGVTSAHALRAATEHLFRLPGVTATWTWTQRDDALVIENERGEVPTSVRGSTARSTDMPSRGRVVGTDRIVPSVLDGRVIGLHEDPYAAVGIAIDPSASGAERRDALMLDIADATARAMAAAIERERAERAVGELRVNLESVRGQLRAKEEAVATAVHELRTPLTSVGGYAQIVARHLETMQRQVAQLTRLIADLQPTAATSPGIAAEPTDLRDLVRGAVARARVLSDAHVDLEEPATPIVLTVDGPRVGQVIDNLLGNAVKYSSSPARISVGLREEAEGVLLKVTDQGRGISAEDLPRIFDRGYRAAHDVRGQGLGLAVVREVVEAHGGKVGASSPGEGGGSTFWMVLPRAALAVVDPGNGTPPHSADEGEADSVPPEPAG